MSQIIRLAEHIRLLAGDILKVSANESSVNHEIEAAYRALSQVPVGTGGEARATQSLSGRIVSISDDLKKTANRLKNYANYLSSR
ncbi:hypothetical protein ACIP5Z_07070 [Rothia terrae]|jgi:hypothetical protein|uniref:hypothetical protein n=1 Tax=Rothia terrae TaxID=396015 RepID=UPI00382D10E5